MVKDNEGHGFDNEENIFDFYHAIEAFLKKNYSCKNRNKIKNSHNNYILKFI